MVPMRLTCCLIVFLLMISLSNAHFHQAAEVDTVSTRKGVFNGESVVAVAMDQRVVGGRKMGVMKQETVASISSGRCEEKWKKKLVSHAKCKRKNGVKISEDGDEKEFVAFSADYRGPRHHPPKNN